MKQRNESFGRNAPSFLASLISKAFGKRTPKEQLVHPVVDGNEAGRSAESIAEEDRRVTEFVTLMAEHDRLSPRQLH